MKKILLILILGFLISCNCSKDTKQETFVHKWKIDVVYTNGEKETIDCSFKTRRTNVEITLISHDEPCIVMRTIDDAKIVACGVRKFEVISHEKETIITNAVHK